ncbi:MAG: SsrA-binding protein SmpB [bacterium]|nr:SsrA-binding protein SmpB [bacterium]
MKISNKKAFFDYELLERIEAGINLTGSEVKAVRLGKADLTGSFVRLSGSEAYLVNAKIYPYEFARTEGYDPSRSRKLLLHKKEIVALKSKTEGENLTIVPVLLYTTKAYIKAQLAIARSKRKFDKRAAIKKKDQDRELERGLADDPLF